MHNPYAPPAPPAVDDPPHARIQVVGRSCGQCKKHIARKLDGVGCFKCEMAYHRGCLADPDRCAKCGQSMSALEKAAEEAEAAAMRRTARRGRILVWAVVLPYALLEVGLLGQALSAGATTRMLSTAVRMVFELGLVLMTLKGALWARRVLAFFCGANLVMSLLLMPGADAVKSFMFAFVAVLCGLATYVFTFSTAARAYLDSKAPIVESSSR